jgi:hypothetical protein
VISGETVEVRADPDLPPASSSIATNPSTRGGRPSRAASR